MSHKMTISNVAYLSDCVLEEGATVFVEDTGMIFHCIQGFGGNLTWELQSKNRYDFPEVGLELQEITFESPRPEPERKEEVKTLRKVSLVKRPNKPKYLH